MKPEQPVVAVTGARGFIGSNLAVRLDERDVRLVRIDRETPRDQAESGLAQADVIVHLAGANRPVDPAEYMTVNRDFTQVVAEAVAKGGRRPLVIFASSARASEDSDYGRSKLAAESALLGLAERGEATTLVYRLPNVFGKWARPDYNSAVATFCHNLARGLPIRIDDPDAPLSLLYIDDLVEQWLDAIDHPPARGGVIEPRGVQSTTVGAVAEQIRAFAACRRKGAVGPVGRGIERALYATFVANLPDSAFSYPLEPHADARGSFTEMLKTPSSGQVSTFTALPGCTRGGHYHHTKVEKFLVVHGAAQFRFRHILSGERHELHTSAERPVVVETVPGWTHDVTNVGDEPLIAIVWANELFDPERPDTVAMRV